MKSNMPTNSYFTLIDLFKKHLDVVNVDFLTSHIEGYVHHEWVTYRNPDRDWFLKDYVPRLDIYGQDCLGIAPNDDRIFICNSKIEDKYLNKIFESLIVHHEDIPYDELNDNIALETQILKWKYEISNLYDRNEHIKVTIWNALRREFDTNVRFEVEEYARNLLKVPSSYNFAEFTCEGMCFEIVDYLRPAVRLKSISGVWGNLTHYRSNRPVLPNQERIEIPQKLYSIWLGEFYVVEIGRGTFDNLVNCRELYLPISINKIEWGFWNCRRLERIEIPHSSWDKLHYISIDGVLYTSDGKTLLVYPNAHGTVYEIPEGVTKIGKFAFKSCEGIEQLILPSTIKLIEINAFYRCKNLKSILCNMSEQKFKFEGFSDGSEDVGIRWYFANEAM